MRHLILVDYSITSTVSLISTSLLKYPFCKQSPGNLGFALEDCLSKTGERKTLYEKGLSALNFPIHTFY